MGYGLIGGMAGLPVLEASSMAPLPELGQPEVYPDVAKHPPGGKIIPWLRTAALGYTFDHFTSLSLSFLSIKWGLYCPAHSHWVGLPAGDAGK